MQKPESTLILNEKDFPRIAPQGAVRE